MTAVKFASRSFHPRHLREMVLTVSVRFSSPLPFFLPLPALVVRSAASVSAVTQQCFKDECDINILLKKFAVTGQLPENVRVPQFADFEEAFDFQSSMNVIRAAEEASNAMPAEVS